jgi:hypothetical protein
MSAFLKNWPKKGPGGRCSSLRPPWGGKANFVDCRFGIWPNTQCITPEYALHTTRSPPPVVHCINTYRYLCTHTEGGGTSETVRGAPVHRMGSKIPTCLTVSPVYKLYQTTVKTTFRIWCLYSYLFYALGYRKNRLRWTVLLVNVFWSMP